MLSGTNLRLGPTTVPQAKNLNLNPRRKTRRPGGLDTNTEDAPFMIASSSPTKTTPQVSEPTQPVSPYIGEPNAVSANGAPPAASSPASEGEDGLATGAGESHVPSLQANATEKRPKYLIRSFRVWIRVSQYPLGLTNRRRRSEQQDHNKRSFRISNR